MTEMERIRSLYSANLILADLVLQDLRENVRMGNLIQQGIDEVSKRVAPVRPKVGR